MSDSTNSDGAVSRVEVEELADLFDRYAYALDPLSTATSLSISCRLAETSQVKQVVRIRFSSMMEADKAKYGYDARQERDFLAQQEKG